MARRKKSRTKTTTKITKPKAVEKKPIGVRKTNQISGLSITAFVFSLLGIIFSWMLSFGWSFSLLAMIFSYVSMRNDKNKGLAILSFIVGLIGFFLYFLLLIFRKSSNLI